MRRYALLLIGHISVGLAIAGILLPILPTTPFLILAAACYSKASQRFHKWLINHKRLGPSLAQWKKYGAISLKIKCFVIPFILANLTYVLFFTQIHIAVKCIVFLTIFGVAIFIGTRPLPPKKP